MKIDNNTVEQARNTDIIDFLKKYEGLDFTHQSGAYRCKQHPSLAVKNDRLSWYWHSQGVGGFGPLDYLVKVEKHSFRDAVGIVVPLGFDTARDNPPPKPKTVTPPQPPKILILPEKKNLPLRLYDYLCVKRGIDTDIVNMLMQKGMLYEDNRKNVVFVGYDEHSKPRFASVRGTVGDCSFRGDCAGSDKQYGFNMTFPQTERLYIFESAIDAMSHASLINKETDNKAAWEQHSRLSLAGTADTALLKYLDMYPKTKELVFCLDNDTVGRDAAINLMRKYAEKGYFARVEPPEGKDFNVDLLDYAKRATPQKASKRDIAL